MGWFHNPGGVWLASELLNEDVVVAWEDISLGDNIHLKVSTKFIFFSKRLILSFQIFSVSFDILDHEVFLAKFVRVGEMVQYLIVAQPETGVWIENSALNCPGQCPEHVPFILVGGSGPASSLEVGDEDALF